MLSKVFTRGAFLLWQEVFQKKAFSFPWPQLPLSQLENTTHQSIEIVNFDQSPTSDHRKVPELFRTGAFLNQ